jgi:hypothetical protein
MSYSKPIWNDVTSCGYAKSPSWGGKNDVKQVTYTGSYASNSEKLATVEISRKFYKNIVVFNFYLDEKLVKQNINLRNKDKAGIFIEQKIKNFVNRTNADEYYNKNKLVKKALKNK